MGPVAIEERKRSGIKRRAAGVGRRVPRGEWRLGDGQERSAPPTEIDRRLLAGLVFRCRPDCGLCCFAEPSLTGSERSRLIQLEPALSLLADGAPLDQLPSRGDGGACVLLERSRCRRHDARPRPCRTYPLHVHVGLRVQATAVLGCPGVDLAAILEDRAPTQLSRDPIGLADELAEAGRSLATLPVESWLRENARRYRTLARRLDREGRWTDPAEIRRSLRTEGARLARTFYPPPDPPSRSDGISTLPLFHDEKAGVVALARHPGGLELLELREDGDEAATLAVHELPSSPPALEPGAEKGLVAYLAHLLERDLTYWAALSSLSEGSEATLEEEVRADLGWTGATVLARAWFRSALRGASGRRLGLEELLLGIRATDAEFLDRPTLGRVL